MPVEPLETLLAHKVINLSDLSGTEKRVAAALIESFNRETGQCDPSLGRIARLIGMHRRTVIRAMPNLERAGMFRKERHAGKSHRNSYEPLWSFFTTANAAWIERFRDPHQTVGPRMSPGWRQSRHLGGDEGVTQTYLSKPTEKTDLPKTDSKTCGSAKRTSEQKRVHNPASSSIASPLRKMFHVCPISADDAAYASAERRIGLALHSQFATDEKGYAEILKAIDTETYRAAVKEEVKNPGAGLPYVLRQLGKVP